MGQCQECGVPIDDKYMFCSSCNRKLNQPGPSSDSKEIVRELGKLNNNLYYLRLGLGVILRYNYRREIVWSKDKKDFEIKEL